MEIAALDPGFEHTLPLVDDDTRAVAAEQIITIVLLLYDCDPLSCAFSLKWSLRCALYVALYAVRGLYEQASEHLAYKATLSGINLS